MRDDYLWDRSGTPDAEIERLERTLGRLRHKPGPLVLPDLRPQRRPLLTGLAAAAGVALMLLGAGAWLALQRSTERAAQRLLIVEPTSISLAGLHRRAESFELSGREEERVGRSPYARPAQVARASRARGRVEERQAQTVLARRVRPERRDERTLREQELAAEKLMLALRYASSKLNLVQRRIQVNKERGPAS